MVVEAKNITVQYKGKKNPVFVDFNLQVEEGAFFVLTGESGSGKSTLLATLGGYLTPNAGSVYYQGEDMRQWKADTWSKIHQKEIGYLPQSNLFLPYETILDNILLPYQIHKKKDAVLEMKSQAGKWLETFGIKELANDYPHELSGGEQKRAALVRAILQKPKLLLADEPTTGLDQETAGMVAKALQELSLQGTSVIVGTHDACVEKYKTDGYHLVINRTYH